MSNHLENVFQVNLGCKSGERVVIVTDDRPFQHPTNDINTRLDLAEQLAMAAENLGLATHIVTYANLGNSGVEPPEHVFRDVYPEGFVEQLVTDDLMQALLNKTITDPQLDQVRQKLSSMQPRYDVMLVLSGYSVSHTRFRKLLTETNLIRAATMPGVEPNMFTGVMLADWDAVARRSDAVAEALTGAEQAEIHTGEGHVLTFTLDGRQGLSDTGLLREIGDFGNLPGGEAFIAPLEGTATGTVAVGPRDNIEAHHFVFEAGLLKDIVGQPAFQARLESHIEKNDNVRNLAEFGVGTNERASAPDNILEAEKILGTVHLALGDNASFGGTVSVPFHQDYVVYQPTVWLIRGTEKRRILDRGEFLL